MQKAVNQPKGRFSVPPQLVLWLDEVRGRLKMVSGYLGVSPAFMSSVKHGRKKLPSKHAGPLAVLVGVDEGLLKSSVPEVQGGTPDEN